MDQLRDYVQRHDDSMRPRVRYGSSAVEPVDQNGTVRQWFREAGLAELDYLAIDWGGSPVLAVVRYDGPPVPLEPATSMFVFVR